MLRGNVMKALNLQAMSIDDLWELNERLVAMLPELLESEKLRLDERLKQLQADRVRFAWQRRPYPKVHPKYQNPDNPSQTWSGRGKTPRWISEFLLSGKKIDELRISNVATYVDTNKEAGDPIT